jgi:hypothetical protein
MTPEIMVIERDSTIAHPSHASGGYIVLHPGAIAYRNADFVAENPREVLAWCRSQRCEVAALVDPDPCTRRFRVRFPDPEMFVAFKSRFS